MATNKANKKPDLERDMNQQIHKSNKLFAYTFVEDDLLAFLPRIEHEQSSTIGDFGAFEQPRIVEEEQREREQHSRFVQIEREEQREPSSQNELSRPKGERRERSCL